MKSFKLREALALDVREGCDWERVWLEMTRKRTERFEKYENV